MPTYHFHSADGQRFNDEEGTILADDASARLEAVRFAGMMLAHNPHELWQSGQWRVEVTDEEEILLFTIISIAVDAPRPHWRKGQPAPMPQATPE